MSKKYYAILRETPQLIHPQDDLYSWPEAAKRFSTPRPLQAVRLVFRPWMTVLAPEGKECYIKTLSGLPIYEYKVLDGQVFYLRPAESIGFPGD